MLSFFRWLEWRTSVWVKRSVHSSDWGMGRTALLKKSEITAGRRWGSGELQVLNHFSACHTHTHTHQLPLCGFQMASFKIPRDVICVNSFPISSSGKVSSLNSGFLAELSFSFLEWMLLWFLRLKEQIYDKWVHQAASGSRLSLLGPCLRQCQRIWTGQFQTPWDERGKWGY